MERTLSAPTLKTPSITNPATLSGVFLLTSLLLAGCGAPAPRAAEGAVATVQGTPTLTAVASAPASEPVAAIAAIAATPASHPATPTPRPSQSPRATASPVKSVPTVVASPDPPTQASTPAPTPQPTKSVPTTTPAPPATKDPIAVDIGGLVEVKSSKPGLTRIGADKCKLCHKVQFTSWAKTAHAARTPPLDCESCHGAGSEYKAMAIMKDSSKARAAGLVSPDRGFCVKCHKGSWSDDLMKKAHAHKTGA